MSTCYTIFETVFKPILNIIKKALFTLPPSGIHAIWRGLFLGVGTGSSNPRGEDFLFFLPEIKKA